MIHTLTLHPTLDLTSEVDDFRHDDTDRASAVLRAPGGKGIKVSRVAARLGYATAALEFLGGHTGLDVTELLATECVPSWFLPIAGITRTTPTIRNAAGKELRLSAPGPAVQDVQVQVLWRALFRLRPPDWLLASGPLMPGVPGDFYPRMSRHARAQGSPTVVDADGEALVRGVDAGAALIKPSRYELQRLVGRSMPTPDDVLDAAQAIRRQGVPWVAVNLGAEDALLVGSEGVGHARPPATTAQSTVASRSPVERPPPCSGARHSVTRPTCPPWSRRRAWRDWTTDLPHTGWGRPAPELPHVDGVGPVVPLRLCHTGGHRVPAPARSR